MQLSDMRGDLFDVSLSFCKLHEALTNFEDLPDLPLFDIALLEVEAGDTVDNHFIQIQVFMDAWETHYKTLSALLS